MLPVSPRPLQTPNQALPPYARQILPDQRSITGSRKAAAQSGRRPSPTPPATRKPAPPTDTHRPPSGHPPQPARQRTLVHRQREPRRPCTTQRAMRTPRQPRRPLRHLTPPTQPAASRIAPDPHHTLDRARSSRHMCTISISCPAGAEPPAEGSCPCWVSLGIHRTRPRRTPGDDIRTRRGTVSGRRLRPEGTSVPPPTSRPLFGAQERKDPRHQHRRSTTLRYRTTSYDYSLCKVGAKVVRLS